MIEIIQENNYGCCLVAAALTINTLTFLIDDVIRNQSKKKICSEDISAVTPKILSFFEKNILPIIKRLMTIEIFICFYLAINCGKYSFFLQENIWEVACILLLPQISIFLFELLLELVLLIIFVYWFSFRNDRPLIISSMEFVYVYGD